MLNLPEGNKNITIFPSDSIIRLLSYVSVASCSCGRCLASISVGPRLESWLCQDDVVSSGKALYTHFLNPIKCEKECPTIGPERSCRYVRMSFVIATPL